MCNVFYSSGDSVLYKVCVVYCVYGVYGMYLDNLALLICNVFYSSGDSVLYKGMMISNIPNLAFTLGYTNASWTLKADLTAGFVCKVLI